LLILGFLSLKKSCLDEYINGRGKDKTFIATTDKKIKKIKNKKIKIKK